MVTRAAGIDVEPRRLLVRVDQQRRDLEGIDAEGVLHDAADLVRERAGQRARRPRLQQVLLALIRLAQRRQLDVTRSAPCR